MKGEQSAHSSVGLRYTLSIQDERCTYTSICFLYIYIYTPTQYSYVKLILSQWMGGYASYIRGVEFIYARTHEHIPSHKQNVLGSYTRGHCNYGN